METIENNKLIAEFLEWEKSNWFVPSKGFEIRRKYDLELPNKLKLYKEEEIQIEGEWGYADVEQERCFFEDLLFHSDWNWLMEVVEKIESIEYGIYQVDILQEGCKILERCRLLIDKRVGKLESDTTKIESVYLACVEFIKWYNNQNKVS